MHKWTVCQIVNNTPSPEKKKTDTIYSFRNTGLRLFVRVIQYT